MKSDDALARMIGQKLRAIRGKETLEAFKARIRGLGLPADKWNRYENGKETPSTAKIVAICQKLEISADWLLLDMSFTPGDIETVTHSGLVRLWQENKHSPTDEIEEAVKHHEQPRGAGSPDVPHVSEKAAGIAGKSTGLPLSFPAPRNPRHHQRRRKK